MALGLAGFLFLIFAANVVVGSVSATPFLSDVGEMLVLFASSIAFVAAILSREARTTSKRDTHQGGKNGS